MHVNLLKDKTTPDEGFIKPRIHLTATTLFKFVAKRNETTSSIRPKITPGALGATDFKLTELTEKLHAITTMDHQEEKEKTSSSRLMERVGRADRHLPNLYHSETSLLTPSPASDNPLNPSRRLSTGMAPSSPTPRPTYDPSSWKFHTVRVWSKSLKDLPVFIDLPRLAPNMHIEDVSTRPGDAQRLWRPMYSSNSIEHVEAVFDYKSGGLSMSNGDTDISIKRGDQLRVAATVPIRGRVLEESAIQNLFKSPWIRVEKGEVVGVVPTNYVRRVIPPHVPKERKVLDVISTVCRAIEGEERGRYVTEMYWKYVSRDTFRLRDMSKELAMFFYEVLGEESPTARILKACNQAVIAPAVIELTVNVAPKVPFKDGGGWRIGISVDDSDGSATVTHWKRQKATVRPNEPEPFSYFEWYLSIVFTHNGVSSRRSQGLLDANFDPTYPPSQMSFRLQDIKYSGGSVSVIDPKTMTAKEDEARRVIQNYFLFGPKPKIQSNPSTNTSAGVPATPKPSARTPEKDKSSPDRKSTKKSRLPFEYDYVRGGALSRSKIRHGKGAGRWKPKWFELYTLSQRVVSEQGDESALLVEYDRIGGKIRYIYILDEVENAEIFGARTSVDKSKKKLDGIKSSSFRRSSSSSISHSIPKLSLCFRPPQPKKSAHSEDNAKEVAPTRRLLDFKLEKKVVKNVELLSMIATEESGPDALQTWHTV
ncbi:hypothetical protein PROFUN_12771, partial [Planoprotostelium fungivorum]